MRGIRAWGGVAGLALATGCAASSSALEPDLPDASFFPSPVGPSIPDAARPGRGHENDPSAPTTVFTDIDMSATSGCALYADGTSICWGQVMDHQAEYDRAKIVREPEVQPDFGGVHRLAVGTSGWCAITREGQPRCWSGSLPELRDVAQLAFGSEHACARLYEGGLWCWPANDPHRAQAAEGLGMVVDVDTKFAHACAVTENGALYCWGDNSEGQLGVAATPNCAPFCPSCAQCPAEQMQPRRVPRLPAVVQVGTGGSHTCARTRAGEVLCWGGNPYGSLGDGTTESRHEPRRVPGLSNVAELAVGAYHNCARQTDGSVWCWGWIDRDEPRERTRPVRVRGIEGATAIATHTASICAILRGASIACWGDDHSSQRGPFGSPDIIVPLQPE